jgi:hypothetical protein
MSAWDRRSRHDLRGAVHALGTVLRKTVTCLEALVLGHRHIEARLDRLERAAREFVVEQQKLWEREPIRPPVSRGTSLADSDHPMAGALSGPYWEARAKALHERENWTPGRTQWVEFEKFSDDMVRVASNFEPVPGKPGLMRRKGLPEAALEFLKTEGKQDRIATISAKLDAQAKPADQEYQASIAKAQTNVAP